jgi:hypothetical protein
LIDRYDVPEKRNLEEMHHGLKLALQEDARYCFIYRAQTNTHDPALKTLQAL